MFTAIKDDAFNKNNEFHKSFKFIIRGINLKKID
jgi:hypothetical protein